MDRCTFNYLKRNHMLLPELEADQKDQKWHNATKWRNSFKRGRPRGLHGEKFDLVIAYLNECPTRTLREIGDSVGLTKQRVAQIIKAGTGKSKTSINRKYLPRLAMIEAIEAFLISPWTPCDEREMA